MHAVQRGKPGEAPVPPWPRMSVLARGTAERPSGDGAATNARRRRLSLLFFFAPLRPQNSIRARRRPSERLPLPTAAAAHKAMSCGGGGSTRQPRFRCLLARPRQLRNLARDAHSVMDSQARCPMNKRRNRGAILDVLKIPSCCQILPRWRFPPISEWG